MTARDLKAILRQDVQGMHAYAVQDSRGLIKLDAMETRTACPSRCRRSWGSGWARWR